MGSRLTLHPNTVLYEWWSNWAGTPMKLWQLRVRACLIWPHAYYTPLYHVHIEQDADSKENWKLSGKVQESDGTEKMYGAHSLASKFNSQQRWWTQSSHHSQDVYMMLVHVVRCYKSRLFIAYSWSKHFSRASHRLLITRFTTSISSHPIQTHLPTALKILRHETCKLKHLQDVGIYTQVVNWGSWGMQVYISTYA